jgi:hypothetical protein
MSESVEDELFGAFFVKNSVELIRPNTQIPGTKIYPKKAPPFFLPPYKATIHPQGVFRTSVQQIFLLLIT